MRGKAMGIAKDAMSTGITPAYAGKSKSPILTKSLDWDHPRLCGEKNGKPSEIQLYNRITPAYAGKRDERCTG